MREIKKSFIVMMQQIDSWTDRALQMANGHLTVRIEKTGDAMHLVKELVHHQPHPSLVRGLLPYGKGWSENSNIARRPLY